MIGKKNGTGGAVEGLYGRGVLFVFLAGILWSTVGIGIRLMESAVVWQILFYRSISLSVFLFIILYWSKKENPFLLAYRSGLAGLVGGLALVAAYTGGVYSIQQTSVANAMLLFATAPFFAAILGKLVLGESVRKTTWIAIAIAILGVFVMVLDKVGAFSLLGNFAALGSAIGFAIFTITLRWGRAGEMMPAVFISGLLAIPIMAVVCFKLGIAIEISNHDRLLALGMGVFQVGLGLVLYTIGSKSIAAAELVLLSLAEVILGPFWVWLFLEETASKFTLVGGSILVLAIAGNALSGQRHKPPVKPI